MQRAGRAARHEVENEAAAVVTAHCKIIAMIAVSEARDARVFLLRSWRLGVFDFGGRRHQVVDAHDVGIERVRQIVCLV